MFDYDWFHGSAFQDQAAEAKWRCASAHFEEPCRDTLAEREDARNFFDELEVRQLVYLRDGFSYEVRSLADPPSKSHLVFECEPVDEQYKVGAFVVSVPFEEIVRVEVYAVHPTEKPDDMPQITGFRGTPEAPDGARDPRRPGT
jgi:hypothetical protein